MSDDLSLLFVCWCFDGCLFNEGSPDERPDAQKVEDFLDKLSGPVKHLTR